MTKYSQVIYNERNKKLIAIVTDEDIIYKVRDNRGKILLETKNKNQAIEYIKSN